jgi:serine/threonine-protein kinase
MPPEQARGDLARLDERADVFALGAVLCEILTGRPAYVAARRDDLFYKAAAGDLTDAWARLSACGADPDLVHLARRCLRAEVGERPRDAGEVSAAVSAYLGGVQECLRQVELERAAAEARAEGERARAAAERRSRRRTAQLAGLVIVCLLAAGAGVAAWRVHQRNRQEATAAGVEPELEEASRLLASGDVGTLREAREAVRRAEAALQAGDATPVLRERVERLAREAAERLEGAQRASRQADHDRRMVERLERLRLRRGGSADEDYAPAFRDYGIDVEKLEAAEAARLVRASAIRVELASGLDRWRWEMFGSSAPLLAYVLEPLSDVQPPQRRPEMERRLLLHTFPKWRLVERLEAIARQADPDPWRNRLRSAVSGVRWDVAELRKLAEEAKSGQDSLSALTVLSEVLIRLGEEDDPYARFAEGMLRNALERHPSDFWLNFRLTQSLTNAAPPRWSEALPFLVAAAALRPNLDTVQFELARCHAGLRDYRRALAACEKAVRLDPAGGGNYDALSRIHLAQGNLDRALVAAVKAVELAPRRYRLGLADVWERRGEHRRADAAVREALALDPKGVKIHAYVGRVRLRRGDAAEAVKALKEAVRLSEPEVVTSQLDAPSESERAMMRHDLGKALVELKRLDEAKKAFEAAIRVRPRAEFYVELGKAHGMKGDWPRMEAANRAAVARDRTHPMGHCNLAVALRQQGRSEEAVAGLKEAIRLRADYPIAWVNLAGAHHDLGD